MPLAVLVVAAIVALNVGVAMTSSTPLMARTESVRDDTNTLDRDDFVRWVRTQTVSPTGPLSSKESVMVGVIVVGPGRTLTDGYNQALSLRSMRVGNAWDTHRFRDNAVLFVTSADRQRVKVWTGRGVDLDAVARDDLARQVTAHDGTLPEALKEGVSAAAGMVSEQRERESRLERVLILAVSVVALVMIGVSGFRLRKMRRNEADSSEAPSVTT